MYVILFYVITFCKRRLNTTPGKLKLNQNFAHWASLLHQKVFVKQAALNLCQHETNQTAGNNGF